VARLSAELDLAVAIEDVEIQEQLALIAGQHSITEVHRQRRARAGRIFAPLANGPGGQGDLRRLAAAVSGCCRPGAVSMMGSPAARPFRKINGA
jgi:hypothetical protein